LKYTLVSYETHIPGDKLGITLIDRQIKSPFRYSEFESILLRI